MERPYKGIDSTSNATFFTGLEVENTLMKGRMTLFVVGLQGVPAIEEQLTGPYINHIFFGANHSFTEANMSLWIALIRHFLDKGYFCTLDFDVKYVEDIVNSELTKRPCFIPLISCKVPYIDQLGVNAVLKIDDADFDYSNRGVWCWPINHLTTKEKFTSWDAYADDSVL